MKKILLFIFFTFGILVASEYRALEHKSLVYKDENGNGKIDYIALFKATDELYIYARAYPLKFKDEQQKKVAFNDLLKVEKIFDFMDSEGFSKSLGGQEAWYFKICQARIHVMKHNFDVQDEAKKADKIYGELINLTPDNGEIYAEFADFLANSNRLELAEQNYDKALNLGVKRANLGLALVKLARMDQKGALPYLEEYLKSYADDEFAKMLASSIKEGTLKIAP